MKKLLFLFSCIIVLYACSPEEPYNPNGTNNNGYGNSVTTKPKAEFTVQTMQPLSIKIYNKSTNASSFNWNFGDGTYSKEKNPIHRYKTKGVYKISLSVSSKGNTDDCSRTVTIEEPSKVYFAGVIYEKLPINNQYVRFELTDDDIFTTTWCKSIYTLLSTSNMPYTYEFQNPILLDGMFEDDWYRLSIYWNSKNNNSEGNLITSGKFYTNEILSEYPTKIRYKGEESIFTLLFMYR